MEINVGGEGNTTTSQVWLTTSSDRSIEVQHPVVVSRVVICACSGEGSLLRESMGEGSL